MLSPSLCRGRNCLRLPRQGSEKGFLLRPFPSHSLGSGRQPKVTETTLSPDGKGGNPSRRETGEGDCRISTLIDEEKAKNSRTSAHSALFVLRLSLRVPYSARSPDGLDVRSQSVAERRACARAEQGARRKGKPPVAVCWLLEAHDHARLRRHPSGSAMPFDHVRWQTRGVPAVS